MSEFREFIKKRLLHIKEVFNQFYPRYEYHEYSNTHFILVEPFILNTTEEFELMCADIIIDMIELFPDESIAFITKDSLVHLESPEILFADEVVFFEQITFNKNVTIISEGDLHFSTEHFRSKEIGFNSGISAEFDVFSVKVKANKTIMEENNFAMAA